MNGKENPGISRREFARRAAIASAASLVPASAFIRPEAEPLPQQPAKLPQLSQESQAEVEARLQTILNLYGSRFSDAQKADLRRLCILAQPPLDRLRAYGVQNGDGPGLYLKPLIERERKPAPMPGSSKAPGTSKKL